MKQSMKVLFHLITTALTMLVLALSGCGGTGGGGDVGVNGPAPSIAGVAATGGPIIGEITLKDSSSPPQVLHGMTASDGSFAFNTTGLTAPLYPAGRLSAERICIRYRPLASVLPTSPRWHHRGQRCRRWRRSGCLIQCEPCRSCGHSRRPSPMRRPAVQSTLAPMLSLYGVNGKILSSAFNANHAGADALLDGINVTISAGPGATITITNRA